jgi:hypothetical protein
MDIFGLPEETQDAVNSLSRINTLANLAQGLAAGGMTMDMGDWSFAPTIRASMDRTSSPGFPPVRHRLTNPHRSPPSSPRPTRSPASISRFSRTANRWWTCCWAAMPRSSPTSPGKSRSPRTSTSISRCSARSASPWAARSASARSSASATTRRGCSIIRGGTTDTSLLANGFYAMSLDENGEPLTGVELSGAFTAGVELNLLIASAGVEGRIGASIGIYLNDQIGDEFGRIRPTTSPTIRSTIGSIAYGRLFAGIRAYLKSAGRPSASSSSSKVRKSPCSASTAAPTRPRTRHALAAQFQSPRSQRRRPRAAPHPRRHCGHCGKLYHFHPARPER